MNGPVHKTLNKVEYIRQKLRGNYKIHIADRLPFNEKVNAFANEDLTYYLYNRGLMMNPLRRPKRLDSEIGLLDKIDKQIKH